MQRDQLPTIEQLRFTDLRFGYEGHEPLFEKSSFDFPMSEIVWIRSESGFGRSTLLQILAGLVLPQSGGYWINSVNIMDISFEEFLPYRLNIGYGFDFGGLINNRTLLDNITLPLLYHKLATPDEANQRACEIIDFLGASRYKDQRPSFVPGGVRKLTCLIRAIILEPELLLLDDPSVGVGEEITLKFFELIKRSKKAGKIKHVFMSSFDEQLMKKLNPAEIYLRGAGQLMRANEESKAVGL